ncbi:metallophosphoesterase [Paraburkholderia sediminicola]|uniref:metallophosphoesterase n=1 Tax=Paraburkholderia sediminicola TaxID=458836 RepID=UPI0038BA15C6
MRIFVISDLHLGGRPHSPLADGLPGSQICSSYQELIRFIDWVAEIKEDGVQLVVNGDIVDFLMEDDYGFCNEVAPWLPDESQVLKKLQAIIERTRQDDGRSPFDAMATLLARGKALTFMLGNHDVELSLPAVRRYLEDEVLKVGMQGRFRFIYDGEAYVVGDLLIEHGNRYDPWNVIDHSSLRQERSMLSRGWGVAMRARASGHFTPPPGSLMVTQVINRLKQKYRFVDLLKPENHAVVPILLAIHPNLQHVLTSTLRFMDQSNNEFIGVGEPMQSGQLSARGMKRAFDLQTSLALALEPDEAEKFKVCSASEGQLGVSDAWEKLKRRSANISAYINDALGLFTNAATNAAVEVRNELLRIALASWRGKLAIDQSHEEPAYLDAVQELIDRGGFGCVVFGHTHLPKELTLASAGRRAKYINTGTWVDVMQIPQEILEPGMAASVKFGRFIRDIQENRIGEYLVRQLSYADVVMENGLVVSSKLCRYQDAHDA